ncbi:hypothetical protein ACRCRN_34150, partial [Pseudomonas aeruginosa]
MLRIAKQSVHLLDGTVVAAEVLARLQIGNSELSPVAFMSGCSPESWYALDIEVLRLVASCEELRQATVPTFVNVSPATLQNDHLRIPRHSDTQPTLIRTPVPRSFGQAVGAQRRRGGIVS